MGYYEKLSPNRNPQVRIIPLGKHAPRNIVGKFRINDKIYASCKLLSGKHRIIFFRVLKYRVQ